MCDVSWPLKALKALCHCASGKLAQQHSNNKVYCLYRCEVGCVYLLSVCVVQCMDVCMCVECLSLWLKAFVCYHVHVHVCPLLRVCLVVLVLCMLLCVCVLMSMWTCLCVSLSAFLSVCFLVWNVNFQQSPSVVSVLFGSGGSRQC